MFSKSSDFRVDGVLQGKCHRQRPTKGHWKFRRLRRDSKDLENGWADKRRVAARGETCRMELEHRSGATVPNQRERRHRNGHCRDTGVQTAARRMKSTGAAGLQRGILTAGGALTVRSHQLGASERNHGSLQAQGNHHNQRDELTLHKSNSMPRVPQCREDSLCYNGDPNLRQRQKGQR